MTMSIPYRSTGKFKPLFLDYIEGNLKLKLAAYEPNMDAFHGAISARENFPMSTRGVLVDVMKRQHIQWGLDRTDLINTLLETSTYTVTTGHQLSVFGGPLFVVNKILSVVKLAAELKARYPENNFVPVFWLASEDHDYEEVRSLKIFEKEIRLENDVHGPVGRADVEQFDQEVSGLVDMLREEGNGRELADMVKRAYASGTLADATARFWYSLLEAYQFLILDGDDSALKDLFEAQMREELASSKLKGAIGDTESQIQDQDYHIQAPVSDVNLFNLASQNRVKFTANADQSEVHQPVDLSPNVLFRPLYQETILPNLAYVGGPGEVAYWLQLRAGFEAFGVPMPVIWPRATVAILGQRSVKTMEEFNLDGEALVKDADMVIKEKVVVPENDLPPISDITHAYLKQLRDAMTDHPELEQQVEAMGARICKDVDKLAKAVDRQIKSKHDKPVKELKHLFHEFDGGLQDRSTTTLECLLRFGNTVVEDIYEAISTEDHTVKIIKG